MSVFVVTFTAFTMITSSPLSVPKLTFARADEASGSEFQRFKTFLWPSRVNFISIWKLKGRATSQVRLDGLLEYVGMCAVYGIRNTAEVLSAEAFDEHLS